MQILLPKQTENCPKMTTFALELNLSKAKLSKTKSF